MSIATHTNTIEVLCQGVLCPKDKLIADLEGKVVVLNEQLAWFKRQVFGAKSERFIDLTQQPLLPNMELGHQPPPEVKEVEVSYKRRRVRRNRGADTISFPDDLPVTRIDIDLPEEEKICPETGEPLVCIGNEVSRKLARKPGHFYIVEYVRPKYASKTLPELGVKTAPMPDAVIPRCPVDESLLAHILVSKFADHLPLNRQVEILGRSQVKISRQTLSKWVLTIAFVLEPLYVAMMLKVLGSKCIFIDETTVKLLERGKCKTAYMWTYVGGGGGDPPYRFFQFCIDRKHEHPLTMLADYEGLLHSDKYGAYFVLAKYKAIIWCPCMAHVRRKFVEAEGGDPALRTKILRLIRKLFMYERVAWKCTPEKRLIIRAEREKPILDELTKLVQDRLLAGGLLPKSSFAQALNYYQGLVPYLGNYLNHSDARLDNSVAERSVRPIALGRNNWMFVGSEDGGKAAAIILSLVQTCRNLKINPEEYMEDVLRRIMSHPAKRIDELLPDNWLAARMGQPAPPQEVAAKMV